MPCRLGIKIIGTLTLYVHFGKVLKREIFHLRFILQAATCSRLVRFLAKLRTFSIIVVVFVKSWLMNLLNVIYKTLSRSMQRINRCNLFHSAVRLLYVDILT